MPKIKVYASKDLPLIEKAAQTVYKTLKQKAPVFVELDIVDEQTIQTLNRENRQIDKVTDVLSFPMLDGIRDKVFTKKDFPLDYDKDEKAIFLGSIAICEQRAKEQAEEFGHSFERELYYLFVHGLLHLFGYDHMTEEDKTQMREKEEQVMLKLGITR